jgi:peptidoglycan/LPS O-acetylase OafA/YrhL
MKLLSPRSRAELLTASAGDAPTASPERWPALDGLRGVALLAVLALHTSPALLPGGFLGVDLFFVLSGFLITHLLVREREKFGSIRLPRFYLRRLLRLGPALWGMVFVFGLGTLVWGAPRDFDYFRRSLPSILFYFFNWRLTDPTCPKPVALQHLWSLAVEDQFYLVWPLLLAGLLALRVRRRYILALVLVAILAPAFLRGLNAPLPGDPNSFQIDRRIYLGTAFRADALFAGCFVGLLAGWGLAPQSRRGLAVLRWSAWPAAAVVLFHVFTCSMENETLIHRYLYYQGGFTITAVSCAVVVAALVWSPPVRMSHFLEAPALRWVGAVSYGAYLWNLPIFLVVANCPYSAVLRNANWLTWAGSLTAGAVSHFYLEAPFLKLKQRWDHRRAAPIEVVSFAA